MRRKIFVGVGALVVVAGVLAIVFHERLIVAWKLRKYRTDPESVYAAHPELCDRGASVLPAIYDAFDNAPPASREQMLLADTLKCIRGEQSPGIEDADVPADDELIGRFVFAYNAQTDEHERQMLMTFVNDLDFRAEFAIYVGMAQGPHGPPSFVTTPSIEDYRGATPVLKEARRVEWCRVIAPLLRSPPDGLSSSMLFKTSRLELLGSAACDPSDVAILQTQAAAATKRYSAALLAFTNHTATDPEELRKAGDAYSGALGGAVQASTTPALATTLIVPLFEGPCGLEQPMLVQSLEHRVLPAVASPIIDAAARCHCEGRELDPCRAELSASLTVSR